MNTEKKIAKTILDIKNSNVCTIKQACKKNGLSPNFWELLVLTSHFWDDTQKWANKIQAIK